MFQTLVISGGSTKGILFLGALHYIFTSNIQAYYGTSVGAVISLLLSVGYRPLELVDLFRRQNFAFDLLLSKTDIQCVDFDAILSSIEAFLVAKTQRPPPTFQKLYESYGKELHFVTFNYTRGRMEVLSRHTHPDMNCMDAVRASCAIPLLFKQCTYNGDVYIDGYCCRNFPLDIAVKDGRKGIVGLNIDESLERPTADSILSRINNLFFIPITLRARELIEEYKDQCLVISITSSLPFYQFHLSDEDVLSMLIEGWLYAAAAVQRGRERERDLDRERERDLDRERERDLRGLL